MSADVFVGLCFTVAAVWLLAVATWAGIQDHRAWMRSYDAELECARMRHDAWSHVEGSACHHQTVPVESVVTGEMLARLCLDCDAQVMPAPLAR